MMAENSRMTYYGIEMIIFIGISYTAVLLVIGSSGGFGAWPTAAPGSPGATIPVLSQFVSLINFFWGMFSILFNLFTFNIPGMPTEIRYLLTPLYTGMAIACVIIFWSKIKEIVEMVINTPILLYNITLGFVFGSREYFHFGPTG
jgi:hypothetical protein